VKLKVSRKVIYLGVAAVAVAAWLLTEDDSSKASEGRKPTTAVKKNGAGFTDEDYQATFPPVLDSGKNSFRPLIARSGAADFGLALAPNAIPLDFAGGEPNWIFTGVAIIDGAPVALLENSSTQEGVFVKHGDRWKSSRVAMITPDSVVLAGPSGTTRTAKIVDTFDDLVTSTIRPLDLNAAVESAIGGELMITPEARVSGMEELRATEEHLER